MDGYLKEDEVDALRQNVSTAHLRQSFNGMVRWLEYTNGPLDGLHSPVLEIAARYSIIAWVARTPRGVVQVFYEQRDQPLLRYFRDMELMSR